MKNTLFPKTGATSASFNFLKKFIKNLFKKSLICLVIFCFIISPLISTINVFAQEVLTDTEQDGQNNQTEPANIDEPLVNDVDQNIINDNDPDVVVGPDDEIEDNIQETPEEPINPVEEQMQELSSNSSEGGAENPTGKVDGIYGSKPKTDLITGAMIYSYPIAVPQGRLGMTPDLELNYNSQENDNGSVFGYAWGVNIPYIERVNKNGSEKLYTEKYFTSSIDGELVEISTNTYAPRVDNGNFHRYLLTSNGWELTDKSGVVYKFGSSANSRQDNASNTNQVYKWMLDKKEDLNGNYIVYEYYKDAGQIYPQKINYTGHGSSVGIFEVEFLRQSRPDTYTSYKTAFEVTTNYRINEMQVKLNGLWVRKYSLTYTVGDNGYRSLIETITSSAKDKNGIITTLPQTKFTYQKTTPGWSLNESDWTSPIPLGEGYESSFDANGDSWVDILKSADMYGLRHTSGPFMYEKNFYKHNTLNKWTDDTSLSIPVFFLSAESRGGIGDIWDQGVRVGDINGDQLNDLVQAVNGNPNNTNKPDVFNSYIYDRASGWVKNNNWVAKIPFTGSDEVHDFGSHLIDINGDTLPDIIRKQGTNIGEQLNTGSGFANITQDWTSPIDELVFRRNRIIDINADGLADTVSKHWDNLKEPSFAYLNKGDTDWVNNTNWLLPMILANNGYDQGVRFLDVNSDNLIDVVIDPVNQTGGNRGTYLNTGNGWAYKPVWDMVVPEFSLLKSSAVVADINNDGFIDFLRTRNSNPRVTQAYINNGNKIPDLLSKIENGSGSSSEIKYKKSAQYKDPQGNLLNPVLPINLNTVESITNNDGLGHTVKTSYEYADGSYYYNNAFDRKFAGFGKVTQINPDNSKEISYYSQANTTDTANGEYDDSYAKIGKVYRTDILDVNNNLLKQNTTKWESSQIGTTIAYFAHPVQTTSRIFTGSNSYDTVETYTYNTTNGNLTDKTEYGTVTATGYQSFTDTGTDAKTIEYSYTSGALQLPTKIVVKDINTNKVSEKKLYYDNLLFGVASKGNNTSESVWVSGTNYQITNKTYNLFGMVDSVTDARGNMTNINYDTYNLYPSSVTNALSQTTNYTYDYNTGKIVQTIDSNGTINETSYDGFGRPLIERSSSDTSYSSLINKASYTYNDTMGAGGAVPYVKKTTNYSGTLSGDSYILLDGFGRAIRNVVQDASTSFIGTDTVYDNMGRVYKTSLPYTLSGAPYTYNGPTTNNAILNTSAYDSLGRIINVTDILGTTTNSYNLNTVITTDPEGHTKNITSDAYGNLVQVIEHNGGSTYTINYEWNANNNLTKITDALGNIRTFTYDATGNRLSATDLHATTDTDFGTYSYEYDANNNMTKKTTPIGNVINYTYDALNRNVSEKLGTATQITNTYDSCTNGISKLCQTSRTGSATNSFSYTNRGLLNTEIVMLGAKNWITEYSYDYQGNQNEIAYPDASRVRYTRDQRGLITVIENKENIGAWTNVIDSITYNPLGQKLVVTYNNGRTQTYTYNANSKYQLQNLLTDAPLSAKYQDNTYTWSPTGNLIGLTDGVISGRSFTYMYDGLSRLTNVTETLLLPAVGYTESYTYNAIGNILSKTGAGSYTYDGTAPNDYTNPHAAISVGSTAYTYDKNGNLTGFGTSPNNTTLTYNYRNELASYQRLLPSPINMTMLYDYVGSRIKTIDSVGTTYTPNKYYEETSTTNKKHIFLDSQLIATIEVVGTGSPTVQYIHPDHLGGTAIVTDQIGNKVQTLEYYPFGSIKTNTGTYDEKHKFTGHVYDTDTGLNFMQARYQKGNEGRFWQQDPMFWNLSNDYLLNPQKQNSYSYGDNNPLRYIDPTGLFSITTGKIEKGDTLGEIRQQINSKFGISLTTNQLASGNGIKDQNKITAGKSIVLPKTNLELRFDNKNLQAFDNTYGIGYEDLKWKATSGIPGKFEPTPEGSWSIDPKNTEYFKDLSVLQIGGSLVAKGLWPGSLKSWGSVRTQMSNNETGVKETGFYVHGGLNPGSRGCIDLMGHSSEFHNWFTNTWAKPINIMVNY